MLFASRPYKMLCISREHRYHILCAVRSKRQIFHFGEGIATQDEYGSFRSAWPLEKVLTEPTELVINSPARHYIRPRRCACSRVLGSGFQPKSCAAIFRRQAYPCIMRLLLTPPSSADGACLCVALATPWACTWIAERSAWGASVSESLPHGS